MTLGELKTKLNVWARETIDSVILTDSINDGIEHLWQHIMIAQLESFMGGPVTFTLAAASERYQLTSITDPAAPLVVNQVAGGALGGRALVVTYTFVTESGSETNPAPVTNINVLANQVCAPVAPANPGNALGWNLYAGSTAALMCQQNKSLLPFSPNPIPNEPNNGWVDLPNGGPTPPTENSTADDIFYIRNLEIPLTAGGYKSWSQSDLSSMLMQQASRTIASTSEYQNYYWDLINGRQLEIRPKTGISLSPRYFFVHKPRRLRFDQAQIPFSRFAYEAFLRAYCLNNITLSNAEFQTSDAWRTRAETERATIIKTVLQMNHNKDITVQPYLTG